MFGRGSVGLVEKTAIFYALFVPHRSFLWCLGGGGGGGARGGGFAS